MCPFSHDLFVFNKSLIFEVHGQTISCKTPWNLLRDWETSRHLHFLSVRSFDAHHIQLYGMSIMKNLHWKGFMGHSCLEAKSDAENESWYWFEKCQVFCWGGAIFTTPERISSLVSFALTGDRRSFNPIPTLAGEEVWCALSKHELWQEHRQEILNGPIGRQGYELSIRDEQRANTV